MPPPRKRRKAVDDEGKENIPVKAVVRAVKGGRRSVGKLSAFVELPLDILLEIFGLLNPLDLLHLARLSKDFRRVLMSRSTICAWKSARSNLEGFPGPYPTMSEPAWVNLAFMAECHYCTKIVRHPDMYLKARLCPACAKTRLVGLDELLYEATSSEKSMIQNVFNFIPTHHTMYQRQTRKHLDRFALRYEYDAIWTKISTIISDVEHAQFEAERSAYMLEHRNHAVICTQWHNQRVRDRQDEIDALKKSRKAAIYDKLKELGYEKDLQSVELPDSFAEHPLVKKNSPLTDRAWANIKGEMVHWAESMRAKHLAREREALINTRKAVAVAVLRQYKNESTNYPLKHFFPTIADFCTFSPVREVLELPSEVVVNIQSFSAVVPQIPYLCQRWRGYVRRLLSQFIVGPDSQTPYLKHLKLARNVLICTSCSTIPVSSYRLHRGHEDDGGKCELVPLFYPQMLTHACTSLGYKRGSVTDESSHLVHERWRWRVPWNTTCLAKNDKFKTIVETIIQLVELDPSTATVQDMDDADARFDCLLCESDPITRYSKMFILYNWREYAIHVFERHFWDSGRFSRHVEIFLSDDDIPINYYDIRPMGKTVWKCIHCHDLPMERLGGYKDTGTWNVENHILLSHGIRQPKLDQDYYAAYGTPAFALEGQMETMHVALFDFDTYLYDLLDMYRGFEGDSDLSSSTESDSVVDADSDDSHGSTEDKDGEAEQENTESGSDASDSDK
ncbi:uncharacterized protein BT62DRAFT_944525 [Guyanagaster necrorhizus]|uniref:F-box domain-containing protein n=1 Tax=Guyanagaster necrorhizus TaxID=856835 RepID=A0A9P7W0W3_9AGAR|nr:uncharacterized protein BT62DRAFT_944525 [Guyanagaster necrorhizus MCA 3950]KAG7449924.1 hypothetical protein BT62DRAFT_944525 [Guyanagaster necrorhizus MCA 3950]